METIAGLENVPDDIRHDLERGVDILKGGGCSEIYLFGSVAEGRVTTRSDIDFAVRGCPPNHFFKLQGKLLMELGRSVDLVNLDTNADLASFLEREATLVDVG